ncbi:MAG TPA: polysaccharide biosynthesis tyrosine autokinase [Aquabacterium sp.]|nr:polysaccharide biosynthesis tyrosine autokinase [Aquabacterium sp.]
MNAFSSPKYLEPNAASSAYSETIMGQGQAGLPIGEIMSQANNLAPDQIERILNHQREFGGRFGEVAVSLGMVSSDDVLWALSQQFHYPYSQDSTQSLHPDLVVARQPFSDQAEAFRTMRSHLIMKMYSDPAAPRHALAILSPDSGDGKSFFAANLAVAFSQLSGRTLLIDADMRAPRQHEIFGLEDNGLGLSSILTGRATSRAIHAAPQLPNLYILPVGILPPNPMELIERPAFGLMLRTLLTKFDRIIVDTPAASRGADGAVIAAKCGAAALIARQDQSRLTAMQNIVNTVSMGRTQIVGAILNQF